MGVRGHLNTELPLELTTVVVEVLAKGSVCANKVNRSLHQRVSRSKKTILLILSRLMLSNDSSTIQKGDAAAGRPSSSRIKKGCRV